MEYEILIGVGDVAIFLAFLATIFNRIWNSVTMCIIFIIATIWPAHSSLMRIPIVPKHHVESGGR
jgi:hypothetical protein